MIDKKKIASICKKILYFSTWVGGFFAALSLILLGIFLLWSSTLTMPTLDSIESQRLSNSTRIYDRTGEVLLYDMYQDVRRTVIPLEEMSHHVQNATIAIEDSGFYSHYGVEPLAILRAVIRNLQDGDLLGGQGGSTITQQVVKNTLLVRDKKISRKLKEWVLAVKLEREISKEAILEMYLNEVSYGGTKYGVEEASQGFFGKPALDLTVAESAYLAALPQAPSYYSPYGNNKNALDERKNKVLSRMKDLGYISDEEYEEAFSEEVSFRPVTSGSIKAPHFVFYVIDQLTELYGNNVDLAQANLRVITTLDWELQKEAERIVLEKALENSERFNATNASLMAIDPKNGEMLVMVGSRDYFDEEVDGNFNIGLAKRQPGSSFKPFAYAAAMNKGYTTETVVYDVKTQFSTACNKTDFSSFGDCYSPVNYDNTFRGPMTFREALAQSVNIPAVKALYLAGMRETIDLARLMGLTTLEDWRRYGLTLVLGGGEVSLLEMTSAYGVFANDGIRHQHTSIRDILVGDSSDMMTLTIEGTRVLEPLVAQGITDILADNVARTPAFGSDSYLHFQNRDVAVKTGTTNDYRDAWIIGYTPNIAVGAWAGNNNNFPMDKKVAGFIIAPMWNEFMNMYFEKYPDSSKFTKPPQLDMTIKPVLRGYKPTHTAIVASSSNSFEVNTPPSSHHSILHWVLKDNPQGPQPSNPSLDPQYPYWEYGVLLWSATQGSVSIFEIIEGNRNGDVSVIITSPEDGEVFNSNETVEVLYSINTVHSIETIEYYVDNMLIETNNTPSDIFEFTPSEKDLEEGTHTFSIIVKTEKSFQGGASFDFVIR